MFVMDKVVGEPLLTRVTVVCRMCGQECSFQVDSAAINAWIHGELIQYAMPNLSKEQRELLISNTCPLCWRKLFPPEQD